MFASWLLTGVRWVCLVLATALVCAVSPVWGGTFARTFPTSWDKPMVFVDQLGSLSAGQAQFAATHYVGTQKQTSNLIDAIRVYNPNFIMIQYRLGVRDSGDQVSFIHNNTWSSDWYTDIAPTANPSLHEDWFVHYGGVNDPAHRLYQQYGSIKEWIMDCSGLINGNTTNGWKQFWVNATIADINSSHGDGVFADSTHLPWAPNSTSSHVGAAPCTNYIDDLESFYDYVYQQYDAAGKYFIPNIGGLMTSLDTTTGYYTDVHGAMVEGSAGTLSNYDWKLQQNRVLNLLRNGKIYIAQNGPGNYTDIASRVWHMANYLLIRHNKSYINILSSNSQCHWLPEYELNIGSPLNQAVPVAIENMQVTGGAYRRYYQYGMVLVNPDTARSYTFAAADPRWLYTPSGGGDVPTSGAKPAGSFTEVNKGSSISLAAWSGAILTYAPGDVNADNDVDFADYQVLETNFGRTGKNWGAGDFDFDGDVDFADYQKLEANFGYDVPEPATLALLVIGGLLRRRPRLSPK